MKAELADAVLELAERKTENYMLCIAHLKNFREILDFIALGPLPDEVLKKIKFTDTQVLEVIKESEAIRIEEQKAGECMMAAGMLK